MMIGCTLPLMYDNDQEKPVQITISNAVVHTIIIIIIISNNQLSLLLPPLLLLLLL
jgi:hypothetical protein